MSILWPIPPHPLQSSQICLPVPRSIFSSYPKLFWHRQLRAQCPPQLTSYFLSTCSKCLLSMDCISHLHQSVALTSRLLPLLHRSPHVLSISGKTHLGPPPSLATLINPPHSLSRCHPSPFMSTIASSRFPTLGKAHSSKWSRFKSSHLHLKVLRFGKKFLA